MPAHKKPAQNNPGGFAEFTRTVAARDGLSYSSPPASAASACFGPTITDIRLLSV